MSTRFCETTLHSCIHLFFFIVLEENREDSVDVSHCINSLEHETFQSVSWDFQLWPEIWYRPFAPLLLVRVSAQIFNNMWENLPDCTRNYVFTLINSVRFSRACSPNFESDFLLLFHLYAWFVVDTIWSWIKLAGIIVSIWMGANLLKIMSLQSY